MVLARPDVVGGAEFDEEKTMGKHKTTSDDILRPFERWYLFVTRIMDV